MVLLSKYKFKILTISFLFFVGINFIWGQSIEFEKIVGVPEYRLSLPSFDGTYYYINSGQSNQSYFTMDGINFENIGCSFSSGRFAYKMDNDNIISVNSLYDICINDSNGPKLILQDTFFQSYFHYIPKFKNHIYYGTIQNVYRVNELGEVIKIHDWGSNNSRIRDAKIINESLYVLHQTDSGSSLTNRDQDWNIISELKLDYDATRFIIQDSLLIISDAFGNIFLSTDLGLNFEEFIIDGFDLDLQIFGVYDEKIIMWDVGNKNGIFVFSNNGKQIDIEFKEFGNFLNSNYVNDILSFYTQTYALRLTGIDPIKFDTVHPPFTATRVRDVEFHKDTIHALTENGYYRLDIDEEEWYSIKGREIGSVLMELDGEGNIYIPSNEGYNYSSDGGETFSTKVVGTGGDLLSFSDTLLFTGSGQCGKLLGGFPAKISTDGGETWTNADFDPAPCYVKDKQTITEERIWVYDEDVFVSFGPGMGESYWLGYFDRKEERFRMIEPIDSEDYKFYVDREETIYAHPKWTDDIPAYWSNDLGETWKTIPDVPKGLIYPTADSTGTIILHYTEEGLTTYVQWGEDENYTEVPVTPSIDGLIHDLFYTTDGRMILSMQDGNFYIAEGLVNSTDELNSISPDISIYPNPTRQSFSITGEDVDTVTGLDIYDLQGGLLSSSIKPMEALDVSRLSEGVYVLKMKLKDGREIGEKVVVLR